MLVPFMYFLNYFFPQISHHYLVRVKITSSPLSAEFREYFSLGKAFQILPLFLSPCNTKPLDCFCKNKIAKVSVFCLKPDFGFEKICHV